MKTAIYDNTFTLKFKRSDVKDLTLEHVDMSKVEIERYNGNQDDMSDESLVLTALLEYFAKNKGEYDEVYVACRVHKTSNSLVSVTKVGITNLWDCETKLGEIAQILELADEEVDNLKIDTY